jgi:hypothetical protein
VSLADSTEIAVEQSLPLEAVIRKRCDVIAVLLPDSPVSATAPHVLTPSSVPGAMRV